MVDQALVTQAKQLSPADRLELIGELWESLNPDDLPVTEAEKALIRERLAEADADPLAGRSWEEVEAELRQRLP
jgi:putative addiction module component (TIGR02574 family)